MTPERWQRVQDLLEVAFERSEDERGAFLAESCGEDEALRSEVEAMLALETELGDFIETPVFDLPGDSGLEPGSRLGPYRIVSELGRGGMGAVYLAERADSEYEKKVAIKLLKRGLDTDELIRRFRGERQILARLDHPNIGRLLDGGTTGDGRPYLVMDYVVGRPIDAYCSERNLPLPERLRLFGQVCRAVHFAHQNLVVHRDLKPGNILVTADGSPKLLDFGIAKLIEDDAEPFATVAALKMMTTEFASPEQVRGEPVTTATDVYSLGALLYRLLVGRSPYRPVTEGRAALAEAVCEQTPIRPSLAAAEGPEADRDAGKRLRGDLDNIVLRALQKDPARRYESAEQLASDVQRHLDGLPVLARPDSLGYRVGKFVNRHRMGVGLAAAALVAVLAFAIVAWVQR
ncbi:MAG TPA: serine/threonine-protein kinase, partial [Thermoanaerobaculia bacterium]|nr:serine/threonine-protein kinase [Thermoanaerobaculia bacterium]